MKMKTQIIKLNQVLQHFALEETVGIKFRISDQTQISFYPSSCQLQAALTPRPALALDTEYTIIIETGKISDYNLLMSKSFTL